MGANPGLAIPAAFSTSCKNRLAMRGLLLNSGLKTLITSSFETPLRRARYAVQKVPEPILASISYPSGGTTIGSSCFGEAAEFGESVELGASDESGESACS